MSMFNKSSHLRRSAIPHGPYAAMLLLAFLLIALSAPAIALAQTRDVFIPNFWDNSERLQKPGLDQLPRLRFLTTTDFPPFNFIDRKKRLSGFHVDLAREICTQLGVLNRCEIQALPWDELEKALADGEGEAIIAGHQVSSETRKTLLFSRPYMRIPGRFVVREENALEGPAFEALFRKKTGVVTGSAHEAYFKSAFASRTAEGFATRAAALAALQAGDIDAVFSDALSLSFWLTSAASNDCCRFLDGAFESREHFGAGLSVAVAKDRQDLANAMDYALSEISREGRFAELYLRYFPNGLY